MKMQNLTEFLIAEAIIKEDKLEYNFNEIFKNNEFLRLIKEATTKEKSQRDGNNNESIKNI